MADLPPILVVLPISAYDAHLAVAQAEWMADACPAPEHPCLVVYSDDVPLEARTRIDAAVRKAFIRQYWMEVQVPAHKNTWPLGPNQMFEEVVFFCESRCARAFFWMEPDVLPLRPGWMSAFEAEYTACGKPCMGYVQQSWSADRKPRDYHMAGTGIYPRILPDITRAFINCGSVAFDVATQSELIGEGRTPETARWVKHTNQLQHSWLSAQYRLDPDGVIRCEPAEGRIPGQKEFAIARDVFPGAVLHHGCKDSSLVKVMRRIRDAALRGETSGAEAKNAFFQYFLREGSSEVEHEAHNLEVADSKSAPPTISTADNLASSPPRASISPKGVRVEPHAVETNHVGVAGSEPAEFARSRGVVGNIAEEENKNGTFSGRDSSTEEQLVQPRSDAGSTPAPAPLPPYVLVPNPAWVALGPEADVQFNFHPGAFKALDDTNLAASESAAAGSKSDNPTTIPAKARPVVANFLQATPVMAGGGDEEDDPWKD